MNLCETAPPQEPLPWPDGRRWPCTRAWLQAFELRRGFRSVGKRGLTVEGEHVRERRASRAANDGLASYLFHTNIDVFLAVFEGM